MRALLAPSGFARFSWLSGERGPQTGRHEPQGPSDCHCPVTGAPLASLTLAHPRRVPLPGKTERVPRGTHSPEPAAFPLLLPVVLKDCCLLESPGRFLITLTNYNQSHGCGTPGTSVLHRSPGDPDFLVAQTAKAPYGMWLPEPSFLVTSSSFSLHFSINPILPLPWFHKLFASPGPPYPTGSHHLPSIFAILVFTYFPPF